jgi:hypothetical protein
MAVWGRTHYRLGANVIAATRPVLNDEWLAKPFRQPLTDQAREDVGCAAGSYSDDDAHWPRRISLCPRVSRHRRERYST